MNRIDKEWYKSLNFLSKISVDEAFNVLKKKNPEKFEKYFEGETWNNLHQFGYVSSNVDTPQIVTPSGLEQLRQLEDMRRKDLTLIASVLSIFISLVALAKSMGWI